MSDKKKTIKDLTVANDRIINEVAALTKTPVMQMRSEVEFLGSYIAAVMRKGTMEGVWIHKFGKFKPKKEMLEALTKREAGLENGRDDLYRALKNKPLNSKQDEPLRDRPGDEYGEAE